MGRLWVGLGRCWPVSGGLGALLGCLIALLASLGSLLAETEFSCRFVFIFRSSVALVLSCYCCCHLLVGTAGCSVFGLFIGVVFACLG